MSWLVEDPRAVIVIGVFVELTLVAGLWRTRDARWLMAMLGVLALVAGLVTLEWLVETDRERIHATILSAAEALERQDMPAVIEHLAESSPLRNANSRLRRRLPNPALTGVEVTKIHEIRVESDADPPVGQADFQVVVHIHAIPRRGDVTATLVKEQDRWRFLNAKLRDE